MPTRVAVDAFIDQVLAGDFVGAIECWYAEDATIQENQGRPRGGRGVLIAGERRTLSGVVSAGAELLGPPLIDGNHVAIRWRFTFVRPDGSRRVMEEVAWQRWRGDRIVEEIFFYDPAQIRLLAATELV